MTVVGTLPGKLHPTSSKQQATNKRVESMTLDPGDPVSNLSGVEHEIGKMLPAVYGYPCLRRVLLLIPQVLLQCRSKYVRSIPHSVKVEIICFRRI